MDNKGSTIARSVVIILAAGTVLSLVQAVAYADVLYTSSAAWQAAVLGSAQFSETFSEFTQDTYFQTGAVPAGPFSLEQIGHDPIFGDFRNYIDVPPLDFTDNSGVNNAALYTKFGVNTVQMTFASPIFAWGANFFGAESGELVNMVLIAPGGSVLETIPVAVDRSEE